MTAIEWICTAAECSPPLRLAQLFTCAFLAILFLQSGIDKVVDRSGNLEWLTGHFASSPLAGLLTTWRTMYATVASPANKSNAKRMKFPHCGADVTSYCAVTGSR